MPQRSPRTRRGMTLLEVLIATAILVFGMVAVLAALQTGLRTHHRATHETKAAMVAGTVMAEMRSIFSKGLMPTPINEFTPNESADFPGYLYATRITDVSRRLGVRGGPVMGEEYFVEVLVYWKSPSNEKKWLIFSTVMFKRYPDF